METLEPRKYSVFNILRIFSAYLLARLKANGQVPDLVATAQQAHDALYAAWQVMWTAAQARQAALSTRDVAIYTLDSALRNLRAGVQGSTHNDRLSTTYTALFPNGYSDIIRRSPEEKIVLVRRILTLLADFDDPNLMTETITLRAAADSYDTDATALEEAERADNDASAALEVARQAYCVHYMEIYHRLVVVLGSSRLAGTYFRPATRKSPGNGKVPTQPTQPVTPATARQPAAPVTATQPVTPAPSTQPVTANSSTPTPVTPTVSTAAALAEAPASAHGPVQTATPAAHAAPAPAPPTHAASEPSAAEPPAEAEEPKAA